MTTFKRDVDPFSGGINLKVYGALFVQWSWVILLITLLTGFLGWIISRNITPYYRSTTTVLVNAAPAVRLTDYSSGAASLSQLTNTYSQLMTKSVVLTEIIANLSLDISVAELQNDITATPIPNTQLIIIRVDTPNPSLSTTIANMLVQVFSKQIEDIQSQRFSEQKAILELKLMETELLINDLSLQLSESKDTDERSQLTLKLTELQKIYLNYFSSFEQVSLAELQNVSTLVQVESAVLQIDPVRPKVLNITLISAVVGFILSAMIIFLLEMLDDTVKTHDDLLRRYDVPILGLIPNNGNENKNGLVTMMTPRSPIAEAYRSLRTNINYAGVDSPLRRILVTSAEPDDGKTTNVCNLAVVNAQNGKSVLMIDCDLRRPQVGNQFNIESRKGLSDLLVSDDTSLPVENTIESLDLLRVITSGGLAPNPAELLGSKKMAALLDDFLSRYEVVLLDTPPFLAVTDAAVLAQQVDGVIIVVRARKTHMTAIEHMLDRLKQSNVRVLGFIVNDINFRKTGFGYPYTTYVYQETDNKKSK